MRIRGAVIGSEQRGSGDGQIESGTAKPLAACTGPLCALSKVQGHLPLKDCECEGSRTGNVVHLH